MPKKIDRKKPSKITPKEPSSAVFRAGVRRLNKCIEILEKFSSPIKDDKKWPVEYLRELAIWLEYQHQEKYKAEIKEKRKEKMEALKEQQ